MDRIRLTISVTPEVHAAFSRLAAAGSMSLSKAMGEWLEDTLEAAQLTAMKMEEARAAPGKVMREMHAYALGLADETGAVLEKVRKKSAATPTERKAQRAPAAAPPTPRPVIRGVKSPGKTRGERQ